MINLALQGSMTGNELTGFLNFKVYYESLGMRNKAMIDFMTFAWFS